MLNKVPKTFLCAICTYENTVAKTGAKCEVCETVDASVSEVMKKQVQAPRNGQLAQAALNEDENEKIEDFCEICQDFSVFLDTGSIRTC